ncbi:hypothetical protein BV25DRAFT_1793237 [Artomyces pyxidatus]|uniref:Uncharacterized protein n=1 Tax=Artomyces pyxidatus TaxID=48021 RepID=A0ACB8TII9_9AGAM|nr:hypothetical protein BV25DRAFT_1793237 [Artomyces pyxidatus]
MGPWFLWSVVTSTAKLSNFLQVIIFLPLTLSTLSKNAFLLLSLLIFLQSLIHGTLQLLWGSAILPVMQIPIQPFLLLVCFNIFSQTVHPFLLTAASWWGTILTLSSPLFIIMEGMSSLLVVQKLGQVGRELVGDGEAYQFGLLIASAVAYVVSAWWIVMAFPAAASSPLSSTLLGAALTAFLFLTFIGFGLRRTNVIESSGLALFIAYNVWLCGFDPQSFSDPASSYAPLLPNILPHLQTLVNFVTNTLPKPVLIALVYRISILLGAARVLPSIGADSWESEYGVDDGWEGRPTSRLTHVLLTYRQSILVTVYSHLLLLDHSSQVWWRWMNIFFTLVIWSVELLVSGEDDAITKEWKVD